MNEEDHPWLKRFWNTCFHLVWSLVLWKLILNVLLLD